MNNMNNELDRFISDTRFQTPTLPSSAFENLSSWHHDFFQQQHQQNFYTDLLPTSRSTNFFASATLPATRTTNIDTDNSTVDMNTNNHVLTFH
jgi:hypothetical protein